MNRYWFALLSIIVSLRLYSTGAVYFFLEHFAENVPADMDNATALGLAAIALSLFGLGMNVIFHLIVLRRASVEKRFKIRILLKGSIRRFMANRAFLHNINYHFIQLIFRKRSIYIQVAFRRGSGTKVIVMEN